MYRKKRLYLLVTICVVFLSSIFSFGAFALAHSGRTDSAGGHKDNQNKSGLGGYHFHCGGHPPHLHEDGICPYTSGSSKKSSGSASGSSRSSVSKSSSSSGTTLNPIQIKNPKSSISIGEEYTLEVSSTEGSTSYTYTSSNPTVAEVSPEGKVIGHTAGSTDIVIKTASGKTRSVTIAIQEVSATAISFESASRPLVLSVGQTYEPTIVFTPENTTNKTITLSSSDENIVSVQESTVTGNMKGHATITATSANGKVTTLDILVEEVLPTDIKIESSKIDLFLGDHIQLSYEVFPADATNTTVSFQVDDKVLSIEENVVTGIAVGETTIVMKTHNGITREIAVSVLPIPVTAVQIKIGMDTNKKVFHLRKNEKLPLSVNIEPDNSRSLAYVWDIENPNIVEIVDGFVVFKGYGKTKITVEHEGFSDSIEVVYYDPLWPTLLRIFIIALLLFVIFLLILKFQLQKRKPPIDAAIKESEENI